MKNIKRIAYIVLIIVIIVLSLTIYTSATKNNEQDQKEKVTAEIKFLESKLVNLLNSLNNIEFENYKVSIGELSEESKEKKYSESSGISSGGSGGSSGSSSGGQSGGSDSGSGGQSGGGSKGDSSSGGGETNNTDTNKKFELTASGVLNNNEEINWDNIKSEVEILYSSIPTLTLDLYQLNLNQEDILSFNKEFDNLAINVKNENKEQSINQLSKLYEYIPKFAKNSINEEWKRNVLEVKSNIFKAYKNLESENWDEISKNITEAINIYSRLLTDTNIDSGKQYLINKGYIIINELQNTITLKEKEIFLIKYKNLLEELNNL